MFKLFLILTIVVLASAMPRVDRTRRSPFHHSHGLEIGTSLGFGQSDVHYGGYNSYPAVGYLTVPGRYGVFSGGHGGYGGYGGHGGYDGYGGYGGYGGYPGGYGGSYGNGYGGGITNSYGVELDLWR